MEYVLILAMWAGTFAKGDSVALTAAHFKTMQACDLAGEQAVRKFSTTFKTVNYICARVG